MDSIMVPECFKDVGTFMEFNGVINCIGTK